MLRLSIFLNHSNINLLDSFLVMKHVISWWHSRVKVCRPIRSLLHFFHPNIIQTSVSDSGHMLDPQEELD